MIKLDSISPFYSLTNFDGDVNPILRLTLKQLNSALDITPTNDFQKVGIRVTFDENKNIIKIKALNELNTPADLCGSNVIRTANSITFDANLLFMKNNYLLSVLDSIDGKYITKSTFAETFRTQKIAYRLSDSHYSKLSKYHGIGGGIVAINMDTQEVVDIKVKTSHTLEAEKCGILLSVKDNIAYVTCTFANACANTVRLIN